MIESGSNTIYGRVFGGRYFVFGVTVVVIALVSNWLVERLNIEMDRAESAQFHLRLAELKSAVTLMEASYVAGQDPQGLGRFVGANPMDWIEEDAAHYLGVRSITTEQTIPGNWVYDPLLEVIAYRPKGIATSTLISEIEGEKVVTSDNNENHPQWLRFKVVGLLSKDKRSQDADKVIGLELKLVSTSTPVE